MADEAAEVEEAEEIPEPEVAGDQDDETFEIPQFAEQDDDRDVPPTRPNSSTQTRTANSVWLPATSKSKSSIPTTPLVAQASSSFDSAIGEIQPLAPAELEGDIVVIRGPDPFLDPILRVIDPNGAVVENDDAPDGAGLEGFDSQVIIDPTVGGLYSIEARSFFGLGSGEFTLTVEIG